MLFLKLYPPLLRSLPPCPPQQQPIIPRLYYGETDFCSAAVAAVFLFLLLSCFRIFFISRPQPRLPLIQVHRHGQHQRRPGIQRRLPRPCRGAHLPPQVPQHPPERHRVVRQSKASFIPCHSHPCVCLSHLHWMWLMFGEISLIACSCSCCSCCQHTPCLWSS